MNINMQLLENMTEQERFDWFEDIPEEELLAQLDAMAEPERLALLEKIPEEIRCNMGFLSDQEIAFQEARTRYNTSWPAAADFGGFSGKYGQQYKIGWKPTARRNFGSWSARANWRPSAKRKTWKSETSLRTL